MPEMGATVSLSGVTVVLDDRAVLRDIDLEAGPGLTIVRGPNGAGKTTLLRAIAGLTPLARGTRTVGGELLALGHRSQLLRGLSAGENLAFFARFRGFTTGPIPDIVARWGLGADAERAVETLSAGQRRRAALARLDSEPCAVTLLDEPFAELDEEAASLLRDALARAVSDARTVVLATHHGHDLDARATAVARLAGGALVGA